MKKIVQYNWHKVWIENLRKPNYVVDNNLILLNKFGKATQIDHIFISICGIFVIETKNLKGTIVGNEMIGLD